MGSTSKDLVTQKPIYNDTPQTQADLQIAVDYAESVRTFKVAAEANLPAVGNWPGRELYVGDEKVPRVWNGSWSGAASGVDAAGWTFVTLSSGKRLYTLFFGEWSAPAGFGAFSVGANWSQLRSTNVPPPTGRAYSQFLVDVSCWPKTPTNGLQIALQASLTRTDGGTAGLSVFNPTPQTIANTSMDLIVAVTLIER